MISSRFPQQLLAAVSTGIKEPCIDLYETVKGLPSSLTLGFIQNEMNVSINGPMSLSQPNILIAIDLDAGKHLFIKLLRIPQTTASHSTDAKKDAVMAEIQTCRVLAQADIPGLVKCDVVQVTVNHSEGLDVAPGEWASLKMKRYVSSLADLPQLTEKWLYCGFSRILEALKKMHNLNLVHMDVKSDNLFVDDNLDWNLGDFGSARNVGSTIWSFSEVFNPYVIPRTATVIPEMDFVLLCVTIAIELGKDKWKQLCGHQQKVQPNLIINKLNSIKDVTFRNEIVNLFECSLQIVLKHFGNEI